MKKLSLWLIALACLVTSVHASGLVPPNTGVQHSAGATKMLGTLKLAFYSSRDAGSQCADPSTVERLFGARRGGRQGSVPDLQRLNYLSAAIHIAAECGMQAGAGSRWTEDIASDVLAYYRLAGTLPSGMRDVDMYTVGRLFGGYENVKKTLEPKRIFDPAAGATSDKAAGAVVFKGTADALLEQRRGGNTMAFKDKYEGKVVEVSGKVFFVDSMKDYRNQQYAYLSMKHSNPKTTYTSVSCSTYDTTQMEQFKRIEPKTKTYKIRGVLKWDMEGVILDKCELL